MLKEFRDFAMRGNVIDLAFGGLDFSNSFIPLKPGADGAATYASLKAAKDAGAVTVNYGVFINAIINFLIIAFALFMVVKQINRFHKKEAAGEVAPPPPTTSE